MCGIAGIIKKDGDGTTFLLNALDVLETRGYDGYGVAIQNAVVVKAGYQRFDALKQQVKDESVFGKCGIAHNRWATHGEATTENAHPHKSGPITIVHNGDIDNYDELRMELEAKGYRFASSADSEVFAVLVDDERKNNDFFMAVKKALLRLGSTSTYAFLIMDDTTPEKIIATRKGSSPLLWSTENGETYIASEEAALNGFVKNYQELFEGDVALFEAGELLRRENMTGELQKQFQTYEIDPEHYIQPEKTSEFWMHQEMMEAPKVITKALGKRADIEKGIVLGGIGHPRIQKRLRKVKKFFLAGCGTSYHAAQIIAESLHEIAGIEAEAIIASEAIYRSWVFDPEVTALIVISQSGETADVVKLMNIWKPNGMLMLGIVNVPNTQITKLTDAGIYCHIGKEVAVASTKAFLGQVVCGIMFAISMGQQRGLSVLRRDEYITELLLLPQKAEIVLGQEKNIIRLAKKYADVKNFLYMGRKYSAIVASEGALKLKEITWNNDEGIHAIGIPAGEMKHGTLAMINSHFPSFVIAPNDSVFKATMNNVSEIKAKKGNVILLTSVDSPIKESGDDLILVPKTLELFYPILTVIPLQMFAFYSAMERECNPDMPRNLAKAVTVE